MSEPTDSHGVHSEHLLHRLQQGDQVALDSLLHRHLPGLRAFVRLRSGRALRAKEASTDLVQSVCREVLERASEFQHGGETGFRRWLYRTAMRKIADRYEFYRAAKRDHRRELDDASVAACYQSLCSPSREASAREQLERVEAAFDRLPEHYREVVVNARILGLSRADIARQTGQSQGAVRTMLSRALAQLAELLDEDVP